MSYLVLARKYRPVGFDDFIGQEIIAKTLQNAIRLERVAHAYLFCGPRGVGKTSMARVFAKALNCVNGPTETPCGECTQCQGIAAGQDVDVIEIDGASNRGIDEVREVRQNARYAASASRFKIYIIDEVHMLTEHAFNALLKTLEEPPAHVKFFLATTAPAKLPDTILSRVQRFDFRRIITPEIAVALKVISGKEGIDASEEVCLLVARRGRGSMRDALSLFDRIISFCGKKPEVEEVTRLVGALGDDEMARLVDLILQKDSANLVRTVGDLLARGMDCGGIIDDMVQYLRDLLVGRVCGPDQNLLDRPAESAALVAERGAAMSPDHIMYMIEALNFARRRLREGQDDRVVLELAFMKMAESEGLQPVSELIERLIALEESVEASGGPVAAQPTVRKQPSSQSLPASADVASRGEDAERLAEASTPGWSAEDGQGLWQRIIEAARQESTWLFLTLGQARLAGIKDNKATIVFPSDRGKSCVGMAQPEHRKVVTEIIYGLIGRRVNVSFVVEEQGGSNAIPTETPPQDEMIQEARRRFDGQIVQ